MKVILTMAEVKAGLKRFKKEVEERGECLCDITKADLKAIKKGAEDEIACGADGSVYDVLDDWSNSIGLDEFGIEIREKNED